MHKAFNREQEVEIAHKPLLGDEVYQREEHLIAVFGNNKENPIEKNIWKKRLVFFNLPYWSSLDVRYCLDVMHTEKNLCDSLIGTLLKIPRKTKDNNNSHLYMMEMGIRQ